MQESVRRYPSGDGFSWRASSGSAPESTANWVLISSCSPSSSAAHRHVAPPSPARLPSRELPSPEYSRAASW